MGARWDVQWVEVRPARLLPRLECLKGAREDTRHMRIHLRSSPVAGTSTCVRGRRILKRRLFPSILSQRRRTTALRTWKQEPPLLRGRTLVTVGGARDLGSTGPGRNTRVAEGQIERDSLLWYLSGRPGQPAPTDRSRWVTGHRGFCDRPTDRSFDQNC